MLVSGVAAGWGWFRMSERLRCPGSDAGARAPGLRNAAKADPKPASASPEAPVGGGGGGLVGGKTGWFGMHPFRNSSSTPKNVGIWSSRVYLKFNGWS